MVLQIFDLLLTENCMEYTDKYVKRIETVGRYGYEVTTNEYLCFD